MSIEITKQLATKNECYIIGRKLNPKKLLVHSTACPGVMAKRFADGWNTFRPNGRQVCVHAFLDDTECYQLLPWLMQGWHAGGSANQLSDGIEICEPRQYSDKVYFEKVIKRAIELYAFLCKDQGLDASDIVSHAEAHKLGIASNHSDVGHWWSHVGYTMNDFRADVKRCMKSGEVKVTYTGQKLSGTSKPETAKKPGAGDAVYQSYAKGRGWLADVVNYNNVNSNGFAGWIGEPLRALRANVKGNASDVGYMECRLHLLGGGWYNWQRDRQMDANGENFAGDCRSKFDMLQIRIVDVNGKEIGRAKYRVHVIGVGWCEWITGYNNANTNGYAGIKGCVIDAVQIDVL